MSIVCYTGMVGSGKTLHLVNDVTKMMSKGANVLSNTPFTYKTKKGDLLTAEFLDTGEVFKKMFTMVNTVFVLDEAHVVFDAYEWKLLKKYQKEVLRQIRKLGNYLFYTTQNFSQVDVNLRRLTTEVGEARKYKIPIGKTNYLFRNIFYDPQWMENITNNNPKNEAKFITRKSFILPHKAKKLYSMYDTTFLIFSPESMLEPDIKILLDNYYNRKGNLNL